MIQTTQGTLITCRIKRERKLESERKLNSSINFTFRMLVVALHSPLPLRQYITWYRENILKNIQCFLWQVSSGSESTELWADRQRLPLRDRNHPGSDLQLVLSFPSHCSGMFAERSVQCPYLRVKGNSSNLDKAPKVRDSCWLPGKVVRSLRLQFLRKPAWCTLQLLQEQTCSVTGRS